MDIILCDLIVILPGTFKHQGEGKQKGAKKKTLAVENTLSRVGGQESSRN